MKTWSILILVMALAACAAPPTMEELEATAWQTGDWTAVERREDALVRRAERRMARQVPQCPSGTAAYCVERLGDRTCSCVSRKTFESIIGWN